LAKPKSAKLLAIYFSFALAAGGVDCGRERLQVVFVFNLMPRKFNPHVAPNSNWVSFG
jgi:hypothetical protein